VLPHRSHPCLVTARANAYRKAVCRRQDPQPRATAAPSGVNTTRSLGSGCILDQSYGVLLSTVRDSQPQRASRGGRVTLVGGGLAKRWGNTTRSLSHWGRCGPSAEGLRVISRVMSLVKLILQTYLNPNSVGVCAMFWSETSIPGKPRVLVVDSSRNVQGWEADYCRRIFDVLGRKGVQLAGNGPLQVARPQELSEALQDQEAFNCIFLVSHGVAQNVPPESNLSSFWDWLSRYDGLTPKLLAVCTWEDPDLDTGQLILSAEDSFAQFAIVPQSSLTPRAAGLYFMKFFTELDMHAPEEITGKIVWFSRSKARELLRKRHLLGELGMRC